MQFVILVIAAILATAAHWVVRRDVTAALAFGLGLLVGSAVPAVAGLFG